jgi:hypothetical protein
MQTDYVGLRGIRRLGTGGSLTSFASYYQKRSQNKEILKHQLTFIFDINAINHT